MNGTEGSCTAKAVKSAQDLAACDDVSGGCGGKCSCDSAGSCKKKLGESCANASECTSGNCADGVCCSSPCAGPCAACSMAKGASADGICTQQAVKNGLDAGACDANTGCFKKPCTCDAAGSCKSDVSAMCLVATDCASTFCVDGRCCNNACEGTCHACSVVKGGAMNGACTLVAALTQDAGTCNDVTGGCGSGVKCACDSNGACKMKNGEPCATNSNCASDNCTGGFCQ